MRFKALVHVRLRGSVSDAAGNAVMKNVHLIAPNLKPHLLRIGKAIDFWFDAETEEIARKEMDLLSDRMLSNTVIEDWSYELVTDLETWNQPIPVERFMDKVTQQYARMTIHNTVKDMGFEVEEEWEMVDGSIELVVNRWV